MLSKTLPGMAVPDYDEAITAMLKAKRLKAGDRMVIAVENRDGKVYRILKPDGPNGYLNCLQGLFDLGLFDRMGPYSLTSREGYDNRLAPKPAA